MLANSFFLRLASIVVLLSTVSLTACRLEVTFNPTATPRPPGPADIPWTPAARPSPLPTALSQAAVSEAVTARNSPSPTSVPTELQPAELRPTRAPTPLPGPRAPTPPQAIPAQAPPEWLSIPAIDLEIGVGHTAWTIVNSNGEQVSTWVVPQDTAGWHENSALPGHGSNVVISGHHNLGSEVFRNLVEVERGDELILRAEGRDYRYTITERLILPERGAPAAQRQQNGQWILPTVDERVTLVTCWPYHDNSHRLIVVAKPAGSTGEQASLN